MIVGLGVDLVAMARIEAMLSRWGDRIARRVLHPDELAAWPSATARRVEYLAGRIAAKEAASKALGVPPGIGWHDAVVRVARPDPPSVSLSGVAQARAEARGVTRVHLTLSHDGGMAVAVVVLEAT
ncbi:MAG: holo-ACP synthase [Myxococcales bacterium]|nr:holo-ACP synthase [Myxococcales bacterium]